jgi:hypothetical protein
MGSWSDQDAKPAKPTKKNPDAGMSKVSPTMPRTERDRGPVQRPNGESGIHAVQEQPKGTREVEHVKAAPANQTPDTRREPWSGDANSQKHMPASEGPSGDTTHSGERTPIRDAISATADQAVKFGTGVGSQIPGYKKLASYVDWAAERAGGYGHHTQEQLFQKRQQMEDQDVHSIAGRLGQGTGLLALGGAAKGLTVGAKAAGGVGAALASNVGRGALAGAGAHLLESNEPMAERVKGLGPAMAIGGALNGAGGLVGDAARGVGRGFRAAKTFIQRTGDSAAEKAALQGAEGHAINERRLQGDVPPVPGQISQELKPLTRWTRAGVRDAAMKMQDAGGKAMSAVTDDPHAAQDPNDISAPTRFPHEPGEIEEALTRRLRGAYAEPNTPTNKPGISELQEHRNEAMTNRRMAGDEGADLQKNLEEQRLTPSSDRTAEQHKSVLDTLADVMAKRRAGQKGYSPQDLSKKAQDLEQAARIARGPSARAAAAGASDIRTMETAGMSPSEEAQYRGGQADFGRGQNALDTLEAKPEAGNPVTKSGRKAMLGTAQAFHAGVAKIAPGAASVAGGLSRAADAAAPGLSAGGAVAGARAAVSGDNKRPDPADVWADFADAHNTARDVPQPSGKSRASLDQTIQTSPAARVAVKDEQAEDPWKAAFSKGWSDAREDSKRKRPDDNQPVSGTDNTGM